MAQRLARIVLALLFVAAPAAAQSIHGIGDLAGDVFQSQALAVSPNGTWVAGFSAGPLPETPVRWSLATGLEDLASGALPGGNRAVAISDDGAIAVLQTQFAWSESSGLVTLGGHAPPTFFSNGHDVDASGTLATWFRATLFDPEALVGDPLMPPWGLYSVTFQNSAGRITSDGTAIFAASSSSKLDRWTGPGFGIRQTLFGQAPVASAVPSASGDYVVGRSLDDAFHWSASSGSFQLLPRVAAPSTGTITSCTALGVSAGGGVVSGSCIDTVDGDVGFVWTLGGGTVSAFDYFEAAGVDMSGWSAIQSVNDVSDDGRVFAGVGTSVSGEQGFYVSLPRAARLPSSSPLGMLVLVALFAMAGTQLLRRPRSCQRA